MQNNWITEVEESIENQKDKIYYRDIKFYKIDRFFKMAKLCDLHSSQCVECEKNKEIVGVLAKDLAGYLSGNMANRRHYEKHYESIDKHLKLIHGYYVQDYYLSLYTFWGLVLGMLPGALFYFFSQDNWVYYFSGSVMLFVFIARQFGRKKDNQIKKAGKIL